MIRRITVKRHTLPKLIAIALLKERPFSLSFTQIFGNCLLVEVRFLNCKSSHFQNKSVWSRLAYKLLHVWFLPPSSLDWKSQQKTLMVWFGMKTWTIFTGCYLYYFYHKERCALLCDAFYLMSNLSTTCFDSSGKFNPFLCTLHLYLYLPRKFMETLNSLKIILNS